MKLSHLIAIGCIFLGTTIAWYILGTTISLRTRHLTEQTGDSVSGRWGPPLVQMHAGAHYIASNGSAARLQPSKSDVRVKLNYEPVKMGLFWHRTYKVHFEGQYLFVNSTAVTQKCNIGFELPSENALVDNIKFVIGTGAQERRSVASPENGVIHETVELAPGQSIPVTVSYDCRG